MPRKRIERQNTSWRISVEAKRLLELMAERLGTSQSAVFEAAIREKARRERIALEDRAAASGRESRPATAAETPAALDLRLLAQRIRSGDESAGEELRRVIADRRAKATITPAKRPEELDRGWQDRLLVLIEQLRASVPAEWTEEELQERIRQVVAEVRAERAGRH
jgi:hypothetical protein